MQSSVAVAAVSEFVLRAGESMSFVLEEARWSDEALRPADLFSLVDFRDLFSEEYIAADVQLSVGMQTILFTDMVGSTRFYATRGDPDAFAQVKRHFSEVFDVVAAHEGVLVKTIGDAVMAAFADPLQAVRAANAIHGCFTAECTDLDIRLRVSLHRGPCIAVQLNSDIDVPPGESASATVESPSSVQSASSRVNSTFGGYNAEARRGPALLRPNPRILRSSRMRRV